MRVRVAVGVGVGVDAGWLVGAQAPPTGKNHQLHFGAYRGGGAAHRGKYRGIGEDDEVGLGFSFVLGKTIFIIIIIFLRRRKNYILITQKI